MQDLHHQRHFSSWDLQLVAGSVGCRPSSASLAAQSPSGFEFEVEIAR